MTKKKLGEQVVCDEKSEWLKERRKRIMASDSRAILGVGFSNESPLTVWEQKVDDDFIEDDFDDETKLRFAIGLAMEDSLRKATSLTLQKTVKHDTQWRIRTHLQFPWMGATLDGWYHDEGNLIPVEFKNVGVWNRAAWDENAVPIGVWVQVQHQIAVTGAPHAVVVANVGSGSPLTRTVERDAEFITLLVTQLMKFREHIITKVPPKADFSVATAKALVRMHPDDNGLTLRLPDNPCKHAAAKLEWLKDQIKELSQQKREIENAFKTVLADNTYGEFEDGSCVSWKTQERKEFTVKASKTRVLRYHQTSNEERTYVNELNDDGTRKRIEQQGFDQLAQIDRNAPRS